MNVNRKDLTPEELAAWVELSEYDINTVGRFAFGDTDTLWTAAAGINWSSESVPALTTVIVNAMTGEVVYQDDPIECLVEVYEGEPDFHERIDRAIQALESGILRLREAKNGSPETT